METFTLNDLEKQVKDAARTLEAKARNKDKKSSKGQAKQASKTSKRPRKRREG